MAPSHSRLLTWSLPTIAVLLSYLWYKRKRIGARSDPGGTTKPELIVTDMPQEPAKAQMTEEICKTQPVPIEQKKFSRSLSGRESAPIDIVMPKDMRSKSTPIHVSDEDLDEQIKKVKPPKNTNDVYTISKQAIESPRRTSPSALGNNLDNNNKSPKKKANKPNKKQTSKKNHINSEIHGTENLVNGAEGTDLKIANSTETQGMVNGSPNGKITKDIKNESPIKSSSPAKIVKNSPVKNLSPVKNNSPLKNSTTAEHNSPVKNNNNNDKDCSPVETVNNNSPVKNNNSVKSSPKNDNKSTPNANSPKNHTVKTPKKTENVKNKQMANNPCVKTSQPENSQTIPVCSKDNAEELNVVEDECSLEVASALEGAYAQDNACASEAAGSLDEAAGIDITEAKPISSSLNIHCEEFIPRSFENVQSEFKPIKSKKRSISRSPKNTLRQRSEGSSDERDSANHSPVDPLLASPSLSNISDQESLDSGKGGSGSEITSSPPNGTVSKIQPGEELAEECPQDMPDEALDGDATEGVENNIVESQPLLSTVYDFVIPQELVGRLIGKKGVAINEIKRKSNTSIIIRAHSHNQRVQVCVIEGYQHNIDTALKLIREKFPLKKYPHITLEQCFMAFPNILQTPPLYLKLVENINNDTIVSAIVKPNYLFVQQHTHPTYMKLNELMHMMNQEYSNPDSPRLPFPAPDNCIAAGFSVGDWYRVFIINTDLENQRAYVTFLDYGGYAFIDYKDLRQISANNLYMIPFQAQLCILTGIKPVDDFWPDHVVNEVSSLVVGKPTLTRIHGFTEWEEPLVSIYVHDRNGPICLNEELVARGYAVHVTENENICHPLSVRCQNESINFPEESSVTEGAVGGETM